jgi:hypothetical protein
MARAAEAEEADFVFDDAELFRLAKPPADTGDGAVRNRAIGCLVYATALLTHKKGVVSRELFPQRVPDSLARPIHHAEDSRLDQHVDSSVDGDAVDALSGHPRMQRVDRKRGITRPERCQDCAPRPGQATALVGQPL